MILLISAINITLLNLGSCTQCYFTFKCATHQKHESKRHILFHKKHHLSCVSPNVLQHAKENYKED